MAQIEEKRPEGRKLISNILSKIAACKGSHYHLKPKFYKEVDLNWEGYSQEERLRVEDNVSNAVSLELDQAQAASAASSLKNAEKHSSSAPSAKKSADKPAVVKSKTHHKEAPIVPIDFADEESLKMDISSSEDNRSSDSEDDTAVRKKTPPTIEQPVLEVEEQKTDVKQKDRQANDINDYKKWKAKWDTQYPIYQGLCKELEENRNLFEKLGEEMRSAEAHEEQLQVVTEQIEKHYNERNEEMQKKNRKYKKLHAQLKSIKACLLAFESRMHSNNK